MLSLEKWRLKQVGARVATNIERLILWQCTSVLYLEHELCKKNISSYIREKTKSDKAIRDADMSVWVAGFGVSISYLSKRISLPDAQITSWS